MQGCDKGRRAGCEGLRSGGWPGGRREASLRKARGNSSGKSSRCGEQHRWRSLGNVRENKEVQEEEGGRHGETQAQTAKGSRKPWGPAGLSKVGKDRGCPLP